MRIDHGRETTSKSPPRNGFMARLLRDARGNTLAIVGAALVPLAGVIGSGVDMSRAYMAKTRLQSACDAASLAGRRVMTNDTMNETVRAEAVRFFNFNFPQRLYDTQPFTPVVDRPSAGTVRVTASTRIPTAIMQLFGFTTLPIDVTCDASLNFVNTDVLLVLDTTGSMLQNVNGNATSTLSAQKITALRDAVLALYDELRPIQTQLEANGLRLRYGIVPYSSAVNVGGIIREASPNYMAENAEYQTRVANYSTPVHTPTVGTPEPAVVQQYSSTITQSDCDKYGRNVAFGSFSASATTGGGPAPTPTWTRTFSNNEALGQDWGWDGTTGSGSNKKGKCRRRYVETDTTYVTEYRFTNWSYEGESIDVSAFRNANSVTMATASGTGNPGGTMPAAGTYDMLELAAQGTGVTTTTLNWSRRCIMERDTVSTITSSSGYSIPSGAFDLNINLIPSNDETRWRPFLPNLTWLRSAGSSARTTARKVNGDNTTEPFSEEDDSYWACPSAARRLAAFSRTDMETYVNGLEAVGGTYHDIGMLWGARLISPSGIFADSPDTFNSMPVSRHIIFMTDGQLAPNTNTYTTYGIEQNDMRITGSSSAPNQHDRHLQRFKMICNATKSMNVSIWVVAFATSLTPELVECASNSNQASISANRDALIARFREIGSNIGALRLVN